MNGNTHGFFRHRRAVVALVLTAAVSAAALGGVADAQSRSKRARDADRSDTFHWNEAMRSGQRLEVRGINGSIHAVAAGGAEASVRAEKRARRSDPSEVEVRVHETEEGWRICAHYPRPDGSMNEECESQHTQNNDVNVEFWVEVPRGVELEAVTVNGNVEAEDLTADVEVVTVNGNVYAATRGAASGTTVNGNVEVAVGRMPAQGGLEFRTVNGSVKLTLPAGTDADLRATTTNGRVDCELDVSGVTRRSKRSLRGELGNGGPPLMLETVNGSIHIVAA